MAEVSWIRRTLVLFVLLLVVTVLIVVADGFVGQRFFFAVAIANVVPNFHLLSLFVCALLILELKLCVWWVHVLTGSRRCGLSLLLLLLFWSSFRLRCCFDSCCLFFFNVRFVTTVCVVLIYAMATHYCCSMALVRVR